MKSPETTLSKIERNNRIRKELEERLHLESVPPVNVSKLKETRGPIVDRNKQALKEIQAQAAAKPKGNKVLKIVIADIALGALSFLSF